MFPYAGLFRMWHCGKRRAVFQEQAGGLVWVYPCWELEEKSCGKGQDPKTSYNSCWKKIIQLIKRVKLVDAYGLRMISNNATDVT